MYLAGRHGESVFSLVLPLAIAVGIGFGSAVIGAPILLLDLARNVRVIGLEGHLAGG